MIISCKLALFWFSVIYLLALSIFDLVDLRLISVRHDLGFIPCSKELATGVVL